MIKWSQLSLRTSCRFRHSQPIEGKGLTPRQNNKHFSVCEGATAALRPHSENGLHIEMLEWRRRIHSK
jgi:hypothetical protein